MTAEDAADKRREKIIALGTGAAVRDRCALTVSAYLEADREAMKGVRRRGTIRQHQAASKHLLAVVDGSTRLDKLDW